MKVSKNYHGYIVELGQKIKAYRIASNLSQQDVESISGVSKRSLSRLEQGESVQVDTLFKVLITLGLSDNIDLLVPDQTRRPSSYLETSANTPKRVRRKTVQSTFKWGDEE